MFGILVTGEFSSRNDRELLVPTDEARNEHKRLQLQELAALNGALLVQDVFACLFLALSGDCCISAAAAVQGDWAACGSELDVWGSCQAAEVELLCGRNAEGRSALLPVRPERAPAV